MIYLSQMLNKPVRDAQGVEIGKISDVAIATGEMFPRVTSLAFKGPDKTPFMISWRKYVASYDETGIDLKFGSPDIRFSYLQPDEILLSRDLMSKQIVDTQGLKVVRVNDLKFSATGTQLRLLGAEVGIRGVLRGLSPKLESAVLAVARAVKRPIKENIIAWSFMDLLDKDLSQVKLSVSHKRLHELHPADVADIIEQLDPKQRASVFEHLDNAQAAETISELEDEYQSDVIDDLTESRASTLLATMDPDDAADIIGDLPYEKAETLLRLMGVREERAIRRLLGYKEQTAGGIMTTEYFSVPESATVGETVERLRALPEDHEPVQYVYTVDDDKHLTGVLSMRTLVLAHDDARVGELAYKEDLVTTGPETDQEEVANDISKYNILAMPVVDEDGKMLGIVTVDDAFEVMEEEHDEDLAIAGAMRGEVEGDDITDYFKWFMHRELWFFVWAIAAIITAATGGLAKFAGALILMPVVLSAADAVASHASSTLIEYEGDADEDNKSPGHLLMNVVVGVFVSLLCGIVFVLFASTADFPATSSVAALLSGAFLPTAATILLVIIFGTVLSWITRRQHDRGRIISSFTMSAVTLVLSAALHLLLTSGFASLQSFLMLM